MICDPCKKAAAINRKVHDGEYLHAAPHPANCGCPCMHIMAPWEKLYSIARPGEEASTSED